MATEKEANVVPVITEESLQKTLAKIEGVKEEPKATPEPEVAIEPLKKTAAETVVEKGSEQLRKALDVSDVLREHVGLIGLHIDGALETMHKSLQASAERDYAFTRIVEKFAGEIEELRKTIEAFGKEPTAPASERAVRTHPVDVLKKSADAADGAGRVTRSQIQAGLEKLAKACAPGSTEFSRWTQVVAKYESTGQISDADLLEASKAIK